MRTPKKALPVIACILHLCATHGGSEVPPDIENRADELLSAFNKIRLECIRNKRPKNDWWPAYVSFIELMSELRDRKIDDPNLRKKLTEIRTMAEFVRHKTALDENKSLNNSPLPSEEKPEGAIRIAVYGGSTAAGRAAFASWMKAMLADILPDKNIEVYNFGHPAVDSYWVLEHLKMTMKYSPDIVVIYSAQNEFDNSRPDIWYEAMSYWVAMKPFLENISFMNEAKILSSPSLRKRKEVLNRTIRHAYTENLRNIVQLCRENNATPVLMTPLKNLQGWLPLISYFGDIPEEKRLECETIYRKASSYQQKKMNKRAAALFEQALTIDPTPAIFHFRLATSYMQLEKYKEAYDRFIQAVDLDANTSRAPSFLVNEIRKVAEEENAILVDTEEYFRSISMHGVIDKDFIMDNVHPLPEAHGQIAKKVCSTLYENELLGEKDDWRWIRLKTYREYAIQLGITPDFIAESYISNSEALLVMNRGWDALRIIEEAMELYPHYDSLHLQRLKILCSEEAGERAKRHYKKIMKSDFGKETKRKAKKIWSTAKKNR